MEAGLGLDDHRQRRRRRGKRLGREQLPAQRPDRQLDADPGAPSSADQGPQAITSGVCRVEQALGERCAPAPRRRAPRRAERAPGSTAGGSATPSSAQNTAPSTSPVARPATNDASTRSTGTPSAACSARRSSSAASPCLGRREEQVADLVEERRPELGEERDALLREPHLGARSRTAGGRRPSLARSSRQRSRRGRRGRRRAAPREREPVGDARRPIAPAPATRITAASSSVELVGGQRAQRRADVGPDRHAAPARRPTFAAAWNGKRSSSLRSRSASSERSCVGSRTSAATTSGYTDGEPGHGPGRAAGQPARDQRLGSDEDVEPVEQVRLDLLPRLVGDLEPAQVRRALAQPLDHRDRHRVAAARRELVDVERQRRARGRRRREVRLERAPRRAGSTAARSRRPRRRPPRPRAPRAPPCRPSSARRSAPRPASVRRPPRRTARRRAAARRRESRIPSPVVPSARIPSTPPSARKSTYGANARLVERRPAVPKRRQRRRERTPDHVAEHTDCRLGLAFLEEQHGSEQRRGQNQAVDRSVGRVVEVAGQRVDRDPVDRRQPREREHEPADREAGETKPPKDCCAGKRHERQHEQIAPASQSTGSEGAARACSARHDRHGRRDTED